MLNIEKVKNKEKEKEKEKEVKKAVDYKTFTVYLSQQVDLDYTSSLSRSLVCLA